MEKRSLNAGRLNESYELITKVTKMKKGQIKSQKEADEVFDFLVNETIKVQKCDKAQAEKRIRALLDSGILNSGSPDNPATQKIIDEFMSKQID